MKRDVKNMKVIKRNGQEEPFSVEKIEKSITKANIDVKPENQMPEGRVKLIAKEAMSLCESYDGELTAAVVRDSVENGLISLGSAELAKKYIRYGAAKLCA